MGRYAHAPSYIVNTKDDKRRPYDAGGHLMQFQYDKDGNVVANMSDIYDFLPRDFEEKYGAVKEYGPLKTAGMYAMHYGGTPFIVRQNGIPVRFKEIVPEYKTEWQQHLGDFLSQWGDTYDLTLPLKLSDEEIFQIFADKEYGDDILNFMFQEGYLQPKQFKKGGSIHIKKKNRGKFTEYCGGKVTEECIVKGKKSKDPKIRKRATFAANARKWKHENGGILKAQEGTGNLYTPHPLSPVGIALNQAKAMTKGKKDQQPLPGVKEVVGPDGKKVAIRTEQPLVPLEQSIAEWLPGTGDVAEVGQIANDVKNGNYGTAALATAMVALPGNVGKIFRKSDVPASKLTEAERLGIPKGERNQPAKAPTKNQTYKKTVNLESDKDYLEDIKAIHQGFLGETFLDSEHEALLDWFNSPQYKERLVKQGFSEEQINNLLSNIKDKLSRKNLKYAVDLNSIRDWGFGSEMVLKVNPKLYPAYEAMTNGNIKIGGQPINWSLIQLKKGANLDEMVPHEVGGHHLESLVAEFNTPYTSQQITEMGKKAAISSGLPEGYYPSWWETRARALTIAKQMREAGWNPNSPEQVNVWLNKHLLKDHNTNVVQGALYYDRPGFIKAISEGLKNGGKL